MHQQGTIIKPPLLPLGTHTELPLGTHTEKQVMTVYDLLEASFRKA